MAKSVMTDLLAAIVLLYCYLWLRWRPVSRRRARGQRRTAAFKPPAPGCRNARKPPWVREAVIHLQAMMPTLGCRQIASAFNRLHAVENNMTVGKSWVAGTVRTHRYEVMRVRERVRNRQGRPGPINRIWGLDLTGKTDDAGKTHMILGLVDHGSRVNLSLQALKNKSSITILRVLLDVIERCGMPRAIRTDNEAVFTSRLFRFGLRFLGIRHQTTDLHWASSAAELPRHALTEPDVRVSPHPAPTEARPFDRFRNHCQWTNRPGASWRSRCRLRTTRLERGLTSHFDASHPARCRSK